MRQDHQAVLDLLAAFGLPTEHVQSVVMDTGVDRVTTVHIEYRVLTAEPGRVQRTYEVIAREVEA